MIRGFLFCLKRRIFRQPPPTAAWITDAILADLYTGGTVYRIRSTFDGYTFYRWPVNKEFPDRSQAITWANLQARYRGYRVVNTCSAAPKSVFEMYAELVLAVTKGKV